MEVASAYEDRASKTPGLAGARPRKWAKRAGALAGVAVGAGVFFAAQASSFEIIAPKFSVATTAVPASDDGDDSGPSRTAQAGAPPTSGGVIVGHGKVRVTSAAASDFIPASLTDGVITLANAAQAKFAEAPAQDPSMLSASARGEDGASQSGFQSFAGEAQAGFPAAGGAGLGGGGGAGGGGPVGAPSGLPGSQSTASEDGGQPDSALNGLQPPQSVLTAAAGVLPEPATWTSLILGFGLIGATLRRRRRSLRLD
jgi:hypothetical protein